MDFTVEETEWRARADSMEKCRFFEVEISGRPRVVDFVVVSFLVLFRLVNLRAKGCLFFKFVGASPF